MLIVRLLQWPFLLILISLSAMMFSLSLSAWFHADEYIFHVTR
jgi:hypothetical protein